MFKHQDLHVWFEIKLVWVIYILILTAREPSLYTSESDVCRRQILTSKVDPRTERIKNIFYGRRYSNEPERAN